MNNDLISRSALKKAITEATYNFEQIPIRVDEVQEIIDNAPTVSPYEIKAINRGKCMLCGKELTEGLFFCKDCEEKERRMECGADMREADNEMSI